MKTIFLSFLIGTFLLFAGHIYAKDGTVKTTNSINNAEEKIIIIQCTQIWQRYKTALSKGDIEEALKHVSDNSKEEFRNALRSQRRDVHLGEISFEYVRNNFARFKMVVQAELIPGDDIPPGYSPGDYYESEGYVVFKKILLGSGKLIFINNTNRKAQTKTV